MGGKLSLRFDFLYCHSKEIFLVNLIVIFHRNSVSECLLCIIVHNIELLRTEFEWCKSGAMFKSKGVQKIKNGDNWWKFKELRGFIWTPWTARSSAPVHDCMFNVMDMVMDGLIFTIWANIVIGRADPVIYCFLWTVICQNLDIVRNLLSWRIEWVMDFLV